MTEAKDAARIILAQTKTSVAAREDYPTPLERRQASLEGAADRVWLNAGHQRESYDQNTPTIAANETNELARIYLVMPEDKPNALTAIVKHSEDLEYYRDAGYSIRQTSDAQAAQLLIKRPILYSRLDDHAWAAISGHLIAEAHRQQVPDHELRPTPIDLPPSVAESRLRFLAQHPDKRNAQTLYELIEVLRVSEGRQPLFRSQFSQVSCDAPFWAVTEHTPLETLHTQAQALRTRLDALRIRKPEDQESQRRTIDRLLNELAELSQLIDNHPTNAEPG